MQLGPRIRTVVNKTDATGGPFRVFPMEVLAGEPNLETKVVENGNTFQLEYGKVVHFTLPPPQAPCPNKPTSRMCSGLQLARAQRQSMRKGLPRSAPGRLFRWIFGRKLGETNASHAELGRSEPWDASSLLPLFFVAHAVKVRAKG